MVGIAVAVAPLAAQGIERHWEVEITGRAVTEVADLRLSPSGGRILLQRSDSAYQPLQELRITGDSIAFTLPREGWHFAGAVTSGQMSGTLRDAEGETRGWRAAELIVGTTRWPVPPRMTFRELITGTTDTVERIPAAWLGVVPDSATVEAEYRGLTSAIGIPPLDPANAADGSRRRLLGLGRDARGAAGRVLDAIAASPAADSTFRAIFAKGRGWRTSLAEVAVGEAVHYEVDFSIDRAGAGLVALGELPAESAHDTAAILESGWRLWARWHPNREAIAAHAMPSRVGGLDGGGDVHALIAGFDDATAWWLRAVRWLLSHAWLDTADGWRSPSQLMARFWGVDTLIAPELQVHPFGAMTAVPTVGVEHVGRALIVPVNASAAEWLAAGEMPTAITGWLPLRADPLPLVIAGHHYDVVSPHSLAEARPAAMFGAHDAVGIDPGTSPLAAVATFMHEWHHLIAAAHRLAGPRPAAYTVNGDVLRLREDDPWLAEGFAEWATDQTLAPVRGAAVLLRQGQAERRFALFGHDADDPHLLGYRLVRALAARMPAAAVRDRIVADMHDLPGLARVAGLGGRGHVAFRSLARPANASIIPEITFTWDDGAVLQPTRRLVIPSTRSEP
ncbi:MAG TPA: hypothetical protein VGM77_03720 [Gemmatimonadales bacterium]